MCDAQTDVFVSVSSGKLFGIITTSQDFDRKNVNDDNIRKFLQENLHSYVRVLTMLDNQTCPGSLTSQS